MIVSAYYNKANDVLTIAKASTSKDIEIKAKGNNTFIYSGESLVGINMFAPEFEVVSGLNDINKINEKTELDLNELFGGELENPFVVSFVEEIEKHPKSEKLNICQINVGNEISQIVCGAKNIDKGQKVIVAKIGAVMPNGMQIMPSKLLDVKSSGMVCSYRELNKDIESNGIAVLSDEYEIGQEYI